MDFRDELVAYCDVNSSPFKLYFEEQQLKTFKFFFQSEAKNDFLKSSIPGTTCSDRLCFVATLKGYLELCASPREKNDIFGHNVRDYDDEDEDDDRDFPSIYGPPIKSPQVFTLSAFESTKTPQTSTSKSASPHSAFLPQAESNPLTTTITEVPAGTADPVDYTELFQQIQGTSKSIYFFNSRIEDPCVIDGKFSAVNFDFGEDKWTLFNCDSSPATIIKNESYDLTSPKSEFMKYISTVAKFIEMKLCRFFPYALPNHYASEISSVFVTKYHKLDQMYQRYKLYHTKMCNYVDVANLLHHKLKNLFKIRGKKIKASKLWPYRPSLKVNPDQVTAGLDSNQECEHNSNNFPHEEVMANLSSESTEIDCVLNNSTNDTSSEVSVVEPNARFKLIPEASSEVIVPQCAQVNVESTKATKEAVNKKASKRKQNSVVENIRKSKRLRNRLI